MARRVRKERRMLEGGLGEGSGREERGGWWLQDRFQGSVLSPLALRECFILGPSLNVDGASWRWCGIILSLC